MKHSMVAARAVPVLGEGEAWALLQALARHASHAESLHEGRVGLDALGQLCIGRPPGAGIALCSSHTPAWEPIGRVDDAARALLELYLPLCVGPGSDVLCVAHLGQSLDGRVATVSGASRFVTGPEDLRHTHRLRALFDAVLIGAQTAAADDPQLTTRLVPGRQPVRVVLDPHARLRPALRVFRDGLARTLVVRKRGGRHDGARSTAVEVIETAVEVIETAVEVIEVEVDADSGRLDLRALLAALRARGLRRVFVEGGGITVSHFLHAGLLHRLQLAIAPKIIGSGTPALCLPPITQLSDALSPRCRRFVLGDDTLYDCDLRASAR